MKGLYRAILVIGMAVIIGTAGSSDLGLITSGQESIQLIVGILLVAIGFSKGEVTEWRR